MTSAVRNRFEAALDRLYNEASQFAQHLRDNFRDQPVKSRRILVLLTIGILAIVAIENIAVPLGSDIAEHNERSAYNERLMLARAGTMDPADRAAIDLLGSCIARNQYHSLSRFGRQSLQIHRAEQGCLLDMINQAVLFGGPDKAAAVETRFSHMGFKLDDGVRAHFFTAKP